MRILQGDALFDEVIDISDLILPLLSPQPDAAGLPSTDLTAAQALAFTRRGDILATAGYVAATVTILYDDDVLAAGVVL